MKQYVTLNVRGKRILNIHGDVKLRAVEDFSMFCGEIATMTNGEKEVIGTGEGHSDFSGLEVVLEPSGEHKLISWQNLNETRMDIFGQPN
ncbi:hypothetical protein L6270_01145 [Candidatus Parcubacteria bacterium]|nr:hypothetical protein [Patescibacteria group bacterium]MBU4309751.1 hypothetical protein [Patescibacteria group bacterium]MBU4431757.1 hypothetical protein [Patescibacteria group bacterium]MBU4578090.1 hypothetical protein [Patescibacteria group bacterium]MCG2696628.1 hypothetical protein [Candidatus Parcubacteria bacterium]